MHHRTRRRRATNSRLDRNLEITERLLTENITFTALGKEFNIGRARTQQIYISVIRELKHPGLLAADVQLDHDPYSLVEARTHKTFWISQLTKMKVAQNCH